MGRGIGAVKLLACVVSLGRCALSAAEPASTGTIALQVDFQKQGEPFRGWGTSLCWWANEVGGWPDAKLDAVVKLITDPTSGLGLNVFRYNIGGGDDPGHDHLPRWRAMPGFKSAAGAPYDWSADASQRNVLLKLIQASADAPIIEAFSNSAPWWMTQSGCSAGAADGGPNLKKEFEPAFADYIADVAAHYRETYHVTFNSLEPFNEPSVAWWTARGSQEGMAVPRDQQARVIQLTRAALDQRKLNATLVSAADDNSIDQSLASITSYDTKTLAALGQINTHSYFGGKNRAALRQAAAARQKPLVQSESGPLRMHGDEYELSLAIGQRIVSDLNQLHPQAWCTWQIIDRGAWGVLHVDEKQQTTQLGEMFYVYANFTRAARPGDRFVELDSDRVIAIESQKRRERVLVIVNPDETPRTFQLTLQHAGPLPAETRMIISTATDHFTIAASATIANDVLFAVAPGKSIVRMNLPGNSPAEMGK